MKNWSGSYADYQEYNPITLKPKPTRLESPYLFSGHTPRYKLTTIVNALGTVLRLGYSGSFPGRYSLYLDILASGHTPANPEDVMFMRLPAAVFLDGEAYGRAFHTDESATISVYRDAGVIWMECNVSGDEPMSYRFRMTEGVYQALMSAGRAALAEMSEHEVGAR